MNTMDTGRAATTPASPDTKTAGAPAAEQSVDEVPALALTLAFEEADAASEPSVPVRPTPSRKRGGFASMDRATVRELAGRGGAAAHASGRAHEFTTEQAREAGRKGGLARHKRRGPSPAPTE